MMSVKIEAEQELVKFVLEIYKTGLTAAKFNSIVIKSLLTPKFRAQLVWQIKLNDNLERV